MHSPFIHKEKFHAAIWGFIVGDALGVPYEFTDRMDMQSNPATGMIGYGTHFQPPGTWSDDTSMMFCVLENIQDKWNPKNLAKLFLNWFNEGYHTAHGEIFDIGITTRESLLKIKNGVSLKDSGCLERFAAGNGCLMRVLPYAFVSDVNKAIFNAIIEGGLTHKLPECHEASMFYIKYLRFLADGFNKQDALKYAGGYLRHGWRITDNGPTESSIKYFKRLFSPEFQLIPECDIQSSGFVIHTLEAAIWSFMNSENYQETVLKAVNLGNDTDTIAALAGGLAGTYYGMENIPSQWLNQIVRKRDLEQLIRKWIRL